MDGRRTENGIFTKASIQNNMENNSADIANKGMYFQHLFTAKIGRIYI